MNFVIFNLVFLKNCFLILDFGFVKRGCLVSYYRLRELLLFFFGLLVDFSFSFCGCKVFEILGIVFFGFLFFRFYCSLLFCVLRSLRFFFSFYFFLSRGVWEF